MKDIFTEILLILLAIIVMPIQVIIGGFSLWWAVVGSWCNDLFTNIQIYLNRRKNDKINFNFT